MCAAGGSSLIETLVAMLIVGISSSRRRRTAWSCGWVSAWSTFSRIARKRRGGAAALRLAYHSPVASRRRLADATLARHHDRMVRLGRSDGFSLLEVLVAMLIVGILGAVALSTYSGTRERAHFTDEVEDVVYLERAISFARLHSEKTLMEITGSGCTVCNCYNAGWPGDLAPTHTCWVTFQAAIDKIARASGLDLSRLRDGDWQGAPFYIDENEGEVPATPCNKDTLGIFVGRKLPSIYTTDYLPNRSVTAQLGTTVTRRLQFTPGTGC
jgi:prepilin-type N-terminal cleavage/methylation domain-containing protein